MAKGGRGRVRFGCFQGKRTATYLVIVNLRGREDRARAEPHPLYCPLRLAYKVNVHRKTKKTRELVKIHVTLFHKIVQLDTVCLQGANTDGATNRKSVESLPSYFHPTIVLLAATPFVPGPISSITSDRPG